MDVQLTDEQRKNVLEWVEELESGKREQGTGGLCRYGTFCCLGVASDLHNKLTPRASNSDISVFVDESEVIPKLNFPGSKWFRDTFGFDYMEPFETLHYRGLAHANDWGASFEEIAKAIRIEILGEDL